MEDTEPTKVFVTNFPPVKKEHPILEGLATALLSAAMTGVAAHFMQKAEKADKTVIDVKEVPPTEK